MFTNLPHLEILKAIDFIIAACRSTRRVDAAAPSALHLSDPHGSVEFGKANRLLPQFVTLSFNDVRDSCRTDITTCYFSTFGIFVKQKLGVPMGSPGSTSFAIAYCAYAEHRFDSFMHDYLHLRHAHRAGRLYRFMRYVDDIFGIIAYDMRSPVSQDLANLITHHMTNTTFHPNLRLETEPTANWFPFLEALLCIPPAGPFHIRFHNMTTTKTLHHFSPLAT